LDNDKIIGSIRWPTACVGCGVIKKERLKKYRHTEKKSLVSGPLYYSWSEMGLDILICNNCSDKVKEVFINKVNFTRLIILMSILVLVVSIIMNMIIYYSLEIQNTIAIIVSLFIASIIIPFFVIKHNQYREQMVNPTKHYVKIINPHCFEFKNRIFADIFKQVNNGNETNFGDKIRIEVTASVDPNPENTFYRNRKDTKTKKISLEKLKKMNFIPEKLQNLILTSSEPFRIELARKSGLTHNTINRLAKDPSMVVREEICVRGNLSLDILEYFVMESDEFNRRNIAKRLNLDVFIENLLARDSSVEVRYILSQNSTLSDTTIKILSRDASSLIRETIAKRDKLSTNLLKELAKDDSINVKIAIAGRNNLEKEIIDILIQDKNPDLQNKLKNNVYIFSKKEYL